jgi:Flp pilus assembly protein TadD
MHTTSLRFAAFAFLAALLAHPAAAKDAAPNDPLAKLLANAHSRIAAGQADSAFSMLRRRLFEEVQGMASAPPHPLDERLTRGVVLAAQAAGKPWEGVSAMQTLLPLRPGEIQLHLALGQLELGRGRPESALRHFERALLIDDHEPAALAGFGQARGTLGGIEPGKKYFDQLIQARPQEGGARYGKGVMLLQAGETADALTDLRWAIGLDTKEWRFNRACGQALAKSGNMGEATKVYQQAIKTLKEQGDPLMAERLNGELTALRSGKG